jgi:glycine oxidase
MRNADVAIAGAGIIGLATALDLVSIGLHVVVFDRGQAMRECSWAAAGMLAANDPEQPSALREFSGFSLRLYPEFLATIERLSGQNIPIRTTQTLQGMHASLPGTDVLSTDAARAIVPELRLGSLKFVLLEEQSLDPRDLVRALPEAIKAGGVTLLEQNKVIAIRPQSSSVRIQTTQGEWSALNFVNACGAWASDLADTPISPRKGQILLVESSESLTATIRTPDVYIIPRDGAHVVIGATVENVGYDKQVDPAVISWLQETAADIWPPLRNARVLESWAGLRPATPDSLPVIGPPDAIDAGTVVSDSRGSAAIWLALGHFRNGIMLAPGTARLLRHMILRQPLGVDCRAFAASRFAGTFAR